VKQETARSPVRRTRRGRCGDPAIAAERGLESSSDLAAAEGDVSTARGKAGRVAFCDHRTPNTWLLGTG
jgi:hypothetical protein